LKSEGEVTSLSGADKREVRDNREKWIQTNKKQIQGHTMYVNQIPNQRDDMLTKTRN
jgi:hypothetical protein